jgi:hypothetical protein
MNNGDKFKFVQMWGNDEREELEDALTGSDDKFIGANFYLYNKDKSDFDKQHTFFYLRASNISSIRLGDEFDD